MSPAEERGSVLMLMPAAVFVLLVMGAIAVDSAIAFMAQRELENAVAAAANDAAVAAISEERFYRCGGLTATSERADAVVAAAFAAGLSDVVQVVGRPTVVVSGGDETRPIHVSVSASGTVDLLFSPAIGDLARREVAATSTAVAQVPSGAAASIEEC